MAPPNIKKLWTISANNRIPFVTLNDTMSKYLFGVKQFLVAHGYTVRGSSNGSTASPASTLVSDGIDRWVTAANVTTRGAASGNAQSWIILRDASGMDILLTYQGVSDDIARISMSAGHLFTTQATNTFQPTATDEAVLTSAVTLINNTAASDRSWFGWVDSESKSCRFAIARVGVFVGQIWGVESVTSMVRIPAVWVPPVWGFSMTDPSSSMANSPVGVARLVVASLGITATVNPGMEYFAGSNIALSTTSNELQGARGYPMFPISIDSVTAGTKGKLGNLIDWWQARSSGAVDGDMYDGMRFLALGCWANTGSTAWPWDGVTVPVLT